eukprot:scaffold314_cov68-Skeletonema_menzelii.AAC.3
MSGENNNASGLMKMGGVDPEACCITEQMNETIAEISKRRALAEKLTRKDQIIYRAALKLAESWDSNKDKEKKP